MRDFEPAPQNLSLNQLLRMGNRVWHGVKLGQPDWSVTSHSLALCVECRNGHLLFYVILNAYWELLEFELPATNGEQWYRCIDTSLDSPEDMIEWRCAPRVAGSVYRAGPRSVVVLYALL
jgi:glycogen operon protein